MIVITTYCIFGFYMVLSNKTLYMNVGKISTSAKRDLLIIVSVS